jgi:hypothetical protein
MGSRTARLAPHVAKSRDQITWESIDIRGNVETFTIRTKVLPVELDEKVEGVTPNINFSI